MVNFYSDYIVCGTNKTVAATLQHVAGMEIPIGHEIIGIFQAGMAEMATEVHFFAVLCKT